jgi:hypothetical protein
VNHAGRVIANRFRGERSHAVLLALIRDPDAGVRDAASGGLREMGG